MGPKSYGWSPIAVNSVRIAIWRKKPVPSGCQLLRSSPTF